MGNRARLMAEVEALERVQADLAAIAGRTDDARRQELINLRRALSAQIARVGSVGEAAIAATGDAELARAYRAAFSAMRSAAALHQASWPAVRLGEAPDDYFASVRRVRTANHDFVAWMRANRERIADA